jgi:hypothetical protein
MKRILRPLFWLAGAWALRKFTQRARGMRRRSQVYPV